LNPLLRLAESSRPYRGPLTAALCGLVLLSRVYGEYPVVRAKLVTKAQPAAQGSISIDMLPAPGRAGQAGPIVVIARLENLSADEIGIDVAWNETPIGAATLGASRTARFDFTLPGGVVPRAGDRVSFHGPGGPWQLRYLEVANVHGSSRGLLNAVFVPSAARVEPMLAWPLILLITGGLAWLGLRAGPPWRWKYARVVHGVFIGAVILLFGTSLLSPIVSRFQVLIGWNTFWFYSTLIFLRGLWRSLVDLWRAATQGWRKSPAALQSAVIALLVAGFFAVLMFNRLDDRYEGNYSGFLQLGRDRILGAPVLAGRDDIKKTLILNEGGYDGTYMYLMAYDPLLLAYRNAPRTYMQLVDEPAYRYTRMGFSALTHLCAWGHPEWFPRTMMWLIILSHFLAALALGGILRHGGGHPFWAMLYVFVPGFIQSLFTGLPESLAAAGVLTDVWMLLRSRVALAALCLAAALLVRETGVIFVVVLVVWLWAVRREWRTGFVIGLSVAPLVAWRAYVTWRLFPLNGWDGFFFSPGNVGVPFAGILGMWASIAKGTYYPWHPPLAASGKIYPLVLVAALVVSLVLLWKRRDGLSAAAVAYSLLALSLDYQHVWLHVGSAERVSFDVFVLLLAGFAALAQRAWALRGTLLAFFAFTAVYAVVYSFDAQPVRTVLYWAIAPVGLLASLEFLPGVSARRPGATR
jgi:hypothetical protein